MKRVAESLRTLSLEHLADHPPHLLSGGEKQRVAIAGILTCGRVACSWTSRQPCLTVARVEYWTRCGNYTGSRASPSSMSLTSRKKQPARRVLVWTGKWCGTARASCFDRPEMLHSSGCRVRWRGSWLCFKEDGLTRPGNHPLPELVEFLCSSDRSTDPHLHAGHPLCHDCAARVDLELERVPAPPCWPIRLRQVDCSST